MCNFAHINYNYNNMKISHIEHLGIAVQSIEEALPYFKEVLGLECCGKNVKLC